MAQKLSKSRILGCEGKNVRHISSSKAVRLRDVERQLLCEKRSDEAAESTKLEFSAQTRRIVHLWFDSGVEMMLTV